MALFLSTYTNKVDKKGRVSVPASYRAVLAGQNFQGIVVYPSFVNPCVEASSMQRIEHLSESIDQLDPFSEEHDAFATTILGGCQQLAFDGDGRVVIPEVLMSEMHIDGQALFVGKGQTFEIWNPESFAEYAKKARTLAMEKRQSLRLRGVEAGGKDA